MISQVELKAALSYDPETGYFTTLFQRGRIIAGARAGSSTGHGYRRICLDGMRLYEHHLAWLYVYGVWPKEIDHADGDRSNNAIKNLREASRTENRVNSDRPKGISGLTGAYLDQRTQKWFSKIQLGVRTIWLGTFDTAEEAHEAFKAASEKYHGEFALHNRNPQMETI